MQKKSIPFDEQTFVLGVVFSREVLTLCHSWFKRLESIDADNGSFSCCKEGDVKSK